MPHNNLDYINYKPYLKELKNLCKLFKKKNVNLCLDGGTLLGAARNEDFIPNDDDIDVFYISTKNNLNDVLIEFNAIIRPFLKENGYKVKPISWTVGGVSKLLFGQYHITKNNITIDLWTSWIDENDKFYLSHCITGEMKRDEIFPLKKINLKNNYFKVPNNYKKLLTLLYKDDWKKPSNYRPLPNKMFFQLNILKIIDQYGWAYHFIAKDQQKFSIHNISYCRIDDFKIEMLKNLDIVYFPSPGLGFGRIKNITNIIRQKYPHIKIIGAYAGETKLVYSYADIIISISAKYLPILRTLYPQTPLIFLPESIDTNFFTPNPNKQYNSFIPGYAGRKHNVKRLYLLDKLDFEIKKQTDHAKVFLIKDRNLTPMIKFYNSIDCLLLSSSSECTPRVVLEAMACELPIISTNVGSLNLLIDKEWLVPVEPEERTIEELNARLNILSKCPKLRKQVGKRNRKHILKFFSWIKNQPLWDSMFSYLYANNIPKIVELTNNFNKNFYKVESDLLTKSIPEPPTIKKIESKPIEPIKLTSPTFDIIIKKSNYNIKKFDTSNIINFLNLHSIDFWLLKDSCYQVVINKTLKMEKLYIGVSNKEIKDKMIDFEFSHPIESIIEPNRQTKDFGLNGIFFKVPLPVVKYLENYTGKKWKELQK